MLTDAGGSIYENATLPEAYWKQSNDKYEDYPLHTPPSFAGISDGVIDEVTGIAQLAKLGLEVVTDKQVRDGMAEAVKGLSVEGLKAAAVNMIEERRSIYTGGSPADVTAYTIGKDVVEVASVFYGGFAAKGKQLGEAVEETGGRVRMGRPDIRLKVGDKIAGITVQRIREGTNGRIAVIGRSMGNTKTTGVRDVYAELHGVKKLDVEIFDSASLTGNWELHFDEAVVEFAEHTDGWTKMLANQELLQLKMYKLNKDWAQKLIDEGYTILDMGDFNNFGFSAFYSMEKAAIFK